MRNMVSERSRAAVAKAGMRERGGKINSQGTWQERRGKCAEGEVFRPGKTKRKGGVVHG